MADPDYDAFEDLDEDAPDPEQAAEQQRLEIEEKQREGFEFWKSALGTVVGRREIWNLLTDSGAFRIGNANYAIAGAGFPQDRATDYHMGARDWGDKWHKWFLVHHTEATIQMWVENDPAYAVVTEKTKRAPD